MKKILIIGGGGAGMFSAVVATQLKPGKFEATMLSDEDNIYCRCTSTYVLTGDAMLKDTIMPDSMITDYGVKLVKEKAISIDTRRRKVTTDKNNVFEYDYLVIATGASPFIPPIEGADHERVYTVRESKDIKNIYYSLKRSRKATVVGAGVIGIEIANALKQNGLDVTIVEFADQVLPNVVDKEYSDKIIKHLRSEGIKLMFNAQAKKITSNGKNIKSISVESKGKMTNIDSDMVIMATGVRANLDAIKDTRIRTNHFGIIVNRMMRTNVNRVYACGDVCTPINMITGENMPSQLASNAVQQAKIVGYQIAGFPIRYAGTLGAFAFKFLDKDYAQAGLNEDAARRRYKIVVTGTAKSTDIYNDMKEKKPLELKLIFAGLRMRLVGVQAFGNGVTGHVEACSLAMAHKTSILKLLKYNYIAHPSLTPWPFMNPIIMATEDAMGKIMAKFRRKKDTTK